MTNKPTKKCQPCAGSMPLLAEHSIQNKMLGLDGWTLNDAMHLCRRYVCKNFIIAMALANKITIIAEEMQHHPSLTVQWGICDIEIWSHKAGDLTESDFVLAKLIDNAILDTQH